MYPKSPFTTKIAKEFPCCESTFVFVFDDMVVLLRGDDASRVFF